MTQGGSSLETPLLVTSCVEGHRESYQPLSVPCSSVSRGGIQQGEGWP